MADGDLYPIQTVRGVLKPSSVELTRPGGGDVNAYTAKDVVSDSTAAPTVLTFPGCARVAGGSGYVVKLRMETDQKTCTARFRLHLYHTAPAAVGDNVAFPTLYANKAKRVGSLDLPALACEDAATSTAAVGHNISDRMPFACDAGDTKLYGMLEALDAFTPASAQKFWLELSLDQN